MSEQIGYDGDYGLETISRDGEVPHTRMKSAAQVQSFVRRLWEQDNRRSWVRSRASGLINGNPPYRNSKLAQAGAASRFNINFGTARTYMEAGTGAYYDLFSEAPGLTAVRTSHGRDDDEKGIYGRIMSEEADVQLKKGPLFDYNIQQSQWEMVLFGCGPLWFEDAFKVMPRSAHCGDLKVPERTKSDVEYFEVASIDVDWYPPELYTFIKEREAATAVGWDVEFSRKVIANAMDIRQPEMRAWDWEFYEQEVKNNSLAYYDDTKVCHCAVVLWKEFDNRITQVIVERETSTESEAKFLFRHIGRYDNWRQVLHPMYMDRGHGGFHHSVTGLGVKLFGPMEAENRLLCNLYDKAFAPDLLFKPTTSESTNKFQLTNFSQYGLLPAGFDVQQTPVKGFVTDGIAMFRTSTELMRSNLSSYRQQAPMQKSGNPATKYEKQLEATQASALSKTTFNRYYQQLDVLYTEIVRRLCNLNSTDPMAEEFQERCKRRGVPAACFGRVESVHAVRVIGEGSQFLRRDAVESLGAIAGSMPEDGKNNWINDFIASHAGQSSVDRYNPPKKKSKEADDQDALAWLQVSAMKTGLPPIITNSQNALRFAGVFLQAAVQALQSVQQGANPADVIRFLDLCAPACMKHLQRIANDPLRAPAVEAMGKQLEQLSKMVDKLRQQVQKQQEQKKQQMQKQQQAMSDQALKAQKMKGEMVLKKQKQDATLALQAAKTRQQMALADATTAADITRKNRSTEE